MFVFVDYPKNKFLEKRLKMAEKTYPMTLAEKEQLEQELEELKLVRRPEVVERIKIARSYGDLSENSEYDAAKDEQAFVEGQIQITRLFADGKRTHKQPAVAERQ